MLLFSGQVYWAIKLTQLKILGGAPEEYRGEWWATGDYSRRIGEEAHSPICPLKLPDIIITGDLWWELLRGPQWSHRRLEGRNLRWAAIEIKRTFRRRPHGGSPVMLLSSPPSSPYPPPIIFNRVYLYFSIGVCMRKL